MMRKSKFICSLLLLFLAVSFVYSFDYGFSLNSSVQTVKVDDKPLSYSGSEGLSLWSRIPVTKWASFVMNGSYGLSYDATKLTHQVNLSSMGVEMDFQTSKTAKIGVDLGRVQFTDFSGLIYNNSLDGGKIDFELSESDANKIYFSDSETVKISSRFLL